MTNQELEQWAASRETSELIAKAIQEISNNIEEMNEIWEDPTQAQTQEILNILENDIDADGLCWGMATLHNINLSIIHRSMNNRRGCKIITKKQEQRIDIYEWVDGDRRFWNVILFEKVSDGKPWKVVKSLKNFAFSNDRQSKDRAKVQAEKFAKNSRSRRGIK